MAQVLSRTTHVSLGRSLESTNGPSGHNSESVEHPSGHDSKDAEEVLGHATQGQRRRAMMTHYVTLPPVPKSEEAKPIISPVGDKKNYNILWLIL
jgi:hypothetical protein